MKNLFFLPAAAGLTLSVFAKVPQPWTVVKTDTRDGVGKVSVWGRDYTFGQQAMPTSVVATGDELLAGPIRIVASGTNGAASVWSAGGSWVEKRDDESATVCAWQESKVAIADVIAKVEYDGMVKCTLTVLPQRDQPVRSISQVWLEIPFKPEFARLRVTFPRTWGKTDNAGGIHGPLVWPFRPSVWIGNEEKGLCWFCESSETFGNDSPDRVIEVLPGAKETVLRIRFLDHFTDRFPAHWTFGLQATPIKPFDRTWNANYVFHSVREQDASGAKVDGWRTQLREDAVARYMPQVEKAKAAGAKTVVFHEDWIRIQNDPESAMPVFRKVVDACHELGLKVLVYLGYEISALDPLWQDFGESVINYDDSPAKLPVLWCRQPAQRDFPVCYRSKFAAAWLERAKKAYVTLGVDGYYLDGTIMPNGCVNGRHGCGWTDADGRRRETYPIFPVREMMRRLYSFVHARGGIVNAHQSGCICPATLAFCDSYWDGEQLAYSNEDIRGMLDLEVFRAEFMGRNHGVPCEFLSAERPGKWTYDDAFTVTLLHDVLPRAHDIKVLHRFPAIWKALENFGWTEAEWTPYWKNPLAVSPESVKVSVYKKNGEALIVAANLDAKNAAKAEIALPSGMSEAEDAVTGRSFAVANGKAALEIAPFRHVLIRAR